MPESHGLRPDDLVEINPTYLFRWEEPQQSFVLLYPEGIVKLNESAGEILAEVTGRTRVRDIAGALAAKYDADEVAEDVLAFLRISHDKGWIRVKP